MFLDSICLHIPRPTIEFKKCILIFKADTDYAIARSFPPSNIAEDVGVKQTQRCVPCCSVIVSLFPLSLDVYDI